MDDDPKICPVCDARWLEGQLYWNTGREACPHDLAGLVCNVLHPNFKCVNPCKGSDSGIQWGHPQDEIDKFFDNSALIPIPRLVFILPYSTVFEFRL